MKTAFLLLLTVLSSSVRSADFIYETDNFSVRAQNRDLARDVAHAAEASRAELALAWFGAELPRWYRRCPINVKEGNIGAGGSTKFTFENGEVFGWNMTVQGTRERILDSCIPHEVSHTIFASHFRRPLPRWFDEGAATIVECASELKRQDEILSRSFKDKTYIGLRELFDITEYPANMQEVLVLYAEGQSVAAFLIERGTRKRFLELYSKHLENGWDSALNEVYGFKNVEALESEWRAWADARLLAAN